jgi:arylsulfatase A-like enzyme
MTALGSRGGQLQAMHPDGKGRVRLDYVIPARGLIGFQTEFRTTTSGLGLLFHVFDHYAPVLDKPIAALIRDLKARGLFDETLILWGGEFGRTPASEGALGRDHNNHGFSVWLAGGGVKGGMAFGATDEFGFAAVENKMHVHDLHATMLHLMGIDHEKLTYRYSGRDFRLTDVSGRVVKEILA